MVLDWSGVKFEGDLGVIFKVNEVFHLVESREFISSVLLASPGQSIINRVESWSGVKFGGDFGVEFRVKFWVIFHESWPGETRVRRLK